MIAASDLQLLLDALSARGYAIVGPTVKDSAIVLDEIASIQDLPVGWTDRQENGRYTLDHRGDSAFFGFNHSATSWKSWLNPPVHRLWHAVREGSSFEVRQGDSPAPKLALFGVRACELRAIRKLDCVLLNGRFRDPAYSERRANTLIVAVTCGQAGANCFCSSVGAGPLPDDGFDICLTEVVGRRHSFLVEAATDVGAALVAELPASEADDKHQALPESTASRTTSAMRKRVDTRDLRGILYGAYEHPHWDDIGSRCLSCGNCTMVCPTCFCTTVEDTTDLSGGRAERTRRWDSCFTMDFTFINGGSVRYSAAARYRQWLVHKFASWQDQFGEQGCVGCGRCITWCPAGIDVTEEIRALRKRELRKNTGDEGELG